MHVAGVQSHIEQISFHLCLALSRYVQLDGIISAWCA